MGLFDRIEESRNKPEIEIKFDERPHHKSKSWGSDATSHFNKVASQQRLSKKEKMARKMAQVYLTDNARRKLNK